MKTEGLSLFLLFVIFFILSFNIFKLQIIEGKAQEQRASQNRFRIEKIEAKRGIFLDRKGRNLIEENGKRHYVLGEASAHVIGYLGEADWDELSLFGVDIGDRIGKMGLERTEDSFLQGTDGGIVEEITAVGDQVREFSKREAIAGNNITLTLDKDLQEMVYEQLKELGFSGSVIASTIDGEILAMVSYPSFDPNKFVDVLTGDDDDANKYVSGLFEDKNKPLFNRAIGAIYPPASIFKIITSIAALEEEVIDGNFEIEDTGIISAGRSTFSNWYYTSYGKTDGNVNVVKALQRSNDIFFYKVGENLGIEKLSKWARRFGLGFVTGIKLDGESEGLVPDELWKKEIFQDNWYLGDTYITSIGQGHLQVTPIQIQMMMVAIANGGNLCEPKLIGDNEDKSQSQFSRGKSGVLRHDKIKNVSEQSSFVTSKHDKLRNDKVALKSLATSSSVSSLSREIDFRNCKKLNIKRENLELVREGLEKACETGGTGWPLFEFIIKNEKLKINIDGINYIKEASESSDLVKIPVSCKTGTAETGKFEEENGKDIQKTHAWFSVYAPSENPEIVVTVMLEEAGGGSDVAAPVAKEVLKKYFEER